MNPGSIKKIYDNLQDDESKEVFEDRLLYSLTGDFNFIFKLTEIYEDNKEIITQIKSYNKEKQTILYGAGLLSKVILSSFSIESFFCICDSAEDKWGMKLNEYTIISPYDMYKIYDDNVVVISIFNRIKANDVKETLLNHGIPIERIILYIDLVRECDTSRYFPTDIIHLSEKEIFIDAGCFDFHTSLDFIEKVKKYSKIIAFEPNPAQYKVCSENAKDIKNVTVYECGLWNKSTTLSFSSKKDNPGAVHITVIDGDKSADTKVQVVKLDDILGGEEATFIKMDIEGAELNALKGAKQTILHYKPKLAICLYHKPEDIWEIPEYIINLRDDYKLYLRHHSVTYFDTVLYAV
ncbi:MAG: FkbM family methyltransferase [Oscillospiraceae bacterium]|jgi:FkbM family methyltransferase|nr:FkbM family methyltransferase [Oscillospiraceae bacterium]